MQSLQSVGLCAEDLQKLLEVLPGTIKFSVFQVWRFYVINLLSGALRSSLSLLFMNFSCYISLIFSYLCSNM